MIFTALFLCSAIAWTIGIIGAGGSSILMVPAILVLIGPQFVPQILSLNSLISTPYRLFLFGKHIDWGIVKWALPAMIIGPFIGAYTFTITAPQTLQIILGIFLITYVFQDMFLKKPISLNVQNWHFLPAYIITGFISGLIGAIGPIMNILYLQKGTRKESIVGTKAVLTTVANIIKLATYSYFGSMDSEIFSYGVIAGLGGIVGIAIGKKYLTKISYAQFKKIVLFLMLISGVIICTKGIGL